MPRTNFTKRKYTDKFKAGAIELLKAAGYPQRTSAAEEVARHLKMPVRTLKKWRFDGIHYGDRVAERGMEELQEQTRQELTDLFEMTIRSALEDMKLKQEDATYRDLAWAAAVFLDKVRLMNDKPTQNVQQAITFERRGISTLSESTAPVSTPSTTGSETV